MPATEESLEVWFGREVLSHDGSLTRFLSRLCRQRDELPDLRQETYTRVYQAVIKAKPRSPKAFLFATARNLVADNVRRARVVSFHTWVEDKHLSMLVDEISPEQEVTALGELLELARAFDQLPPKSREVLWLRRIQNLSQREVSQRLGVSEKTVEKHLRQGSRRLLNLLVLASAR